MPFITDGSPLEANPDEAQQGYQDKISPSFSSNVGTDFTDTSLTGMASSMAERGQYKQSSWLDRALVGMAQANAGQVVDKPKDDPEAYKTLMVQQAQAHEDRQQSLARFSNQHSWPVNAASGMASFILDPLQASSAIVPGLGEDALLAKFGSGIIAKTGARIVAGATAGGFSQVPVAAAKLGISSIDDQDYNLRDAATDVFMGAATGAVFHAGLGAASDLFKTITKAPAEVQHQATSTALSQIIEGRPVEVRSVIKPDYSPADLEDKDTLINNRNLTLRSLETIGDDPSSASSKAELEQSLKDIDNKLYVTDLREQEKGILDTVNGNEEELTEDKADELSLIRQELYRTVDQPSDLSQGQQELYEQGYQPSVSQTQLQQTKAEILENSKNPQKEVTLEDHARTASELEVAWAGIEQESLPNMSKEDTDELQTSKEQIDKSNQDEKGYNQAVSCLNEAGI